MKRRFKTRASLNIEIIRTIAVFIFILLLFISGVKYLFKNIFSSHNETKVNGYLAISTNNLLGELSFMDLINLNLASPKSILKLNIAELQDLKLIIPEKQVISVSKEPTIYIYNTHQSEDYDPGSLREYNITPTVYMASSMLLSALKKYQYHAIVENENISNLLKSYGLSYKDSYKISRILLENRINEYSSLKYFIDIHRDSTSGKITIDEITYAKLMLVLGTNHQNYQENEALYKKIYEYLNKNYPGSIKEIRYANQNIFNQDFSSNLILVEVGGVENTIDEVYNSINILAEALSQVIGE